MLMTGQDCALLVVGFALLVFAHLFGGRVAHPFEGQPHSGFRRAKCPHLVDIREGQARPIAN
jgi:hypothetical protein